MSFNPVVLKLGGKEIPLENCMNKESIVVTTEDLIIHPRTAVSCQGRLSPTEEQRRGTFQITPIDDPIREEEEVMLCKSVVEVGGEGQIPIMLANTTNSTIKIPRGRELGRAVSASIRENVVGEADSGDGHTHTVVNVVEPTEHKDKISKVIIENRDVVPNSDKELGQTQSVRMKINTGDHQPIRRKPYRTPLHKRELVKVNNHISEIIILIIQ